MKIAIRFKNDKPVANWLQATNGLKRDLKKSDLEGLLFTADIKKIRMPKTYSQLRYFHCKGFLGRIIDGYLDGNSKDMPIGDKARVEWVKNQIKTDRAIMFYEPFISKDGDRFILLRSFSDATKEEMQHIIDWCIMEYQERFGIDLEPVDDYKKRLKNERDIAKMNKKTLINCDEFAGSCC